MLADNCCASAALAARADTIMVNAVRRNALVMDCSSLGMRCRILPTTAQNGNLYTINHPAVTFQQTTTRSWTDGNRNLFRTAI
jgi:hypothetical protein